MRNGVVIMLTKNKERVREINGIDEATRNYVIEFEEKYIRWIMNKM